MFATFAVTILLAAAPVAGQKPEAVQQHEQKATATGTPCPMHGARRAGMAQARIGDSDNTVVQNDGYAVVGNEGAVAEFGASNELINAAEAGNPNSIDYANRATIKTDNAAGPRAAAANSHPTACSCLLSDARTEAGRR